MVSLLSLAYNAQALIGEKLTKAMWEGNRAEAWFEIRYNSNFNALPGLAMRRYLESQMFGLYGDWTSVGEPEAEQVFKMVENHRREIVNYEKTYGVPVDGTNPLQGDRIAAARSEYESLLPYLQPGTISTLVESLNPAKYALFDYLNARMDLPDTLKAELTDDIISTNIYLNPHKSTDTDQVSVLDSLNYQTGVFGNGANDLMIGMDQFDLMFGRKGNDILIGEGGIDFLWGGEGNDLLYGGEGDDVLSGGIGNDTLMGGENDDTYIINPGDGNDTIEDKQGNDKVILCGKEIKGFYYDPINNIYSSRDGLQTAVLDPRGLVVTDVLFSTTVILNDNFEWGDFGVGHWGQVGHWGHWGQA